MKLTVKSWIAAQKDAEAKRYNMFPDVEYFGEDEFYINRENDTVTYVDVELLKETEKAVYVALQCGAIDGAFGQFKAWFPKSQIVAMA